MGIHVRAVLNQELNRGRVSFIGGPHDRRRTPRRFLGVDIRAVIDERLHCVDFAGARGCHERRPSQRKMLVGICAGS